MNSMRNYLSNIVKRNVPYSLPSMKPAINQTAAIDYDPFLRTGDRFSENIPGDGIKSKDNTTSHLSKKLSDTDTSIVLSPNNSLPKSTKTFITKYTNRLSIGRNSINKPESEQKNFTPETIDSIRVLPQKMLQPASSSTLLTTNNAFTDVIEAKKEAVGNSVKGIIPVHRLKKEIETSGNFFQNKHNQSIVRPVMPVVISNQKINKQEPKLVIGKITVEILPSFIPKQTKIVNRYINTSVADSGSKINTKSFGLGQL